MADTLKNKILSSLIETMKIKKEDIDEAIELQKTKNISLDKALIEKGLINEEDLLMLLVKELRVPFIHLKKYKVDPALKEIVPERTARQYRILPLSHLANTVTVVIADPMNIFAIDDLKNITGKEIDVVMSTDTDIMKAIDAFYGSPLTATVKDVSKEMAIDEFEIVAEQDMIKDTDIGTADEGEQAPIIRLVNLIVREALRQRASDIHMEPTADFMRVRYRIDGVLQDAIKVPRESQNAVTVRIKIMSRLDITASRVPQDGRFKIKLGSKVVDFRVSLLPTTFGQKIVLRVLDKDNLRIGLDGLGFSPVALTTLKECIQQPFGMILVTGPTGSGKSTTLYSVINDLNTVDKNIITIEDPVEYLIEGLTQIHVKPEVGLTFVSGLRAVLRQSPDVVLVGEIRDSETADIAIKAALTGQLVFATLHTNDAAGAMTRLIDMGVESFLVASSVVVVCAQRLCRKICSSCRAPVEIPEPVLEKLNYKFKPGTTFYKGKGCDRCRQTGYYGRIAVTEVLAIDDEIREMLILRKSSDEIKEYARKSCGMVILWEDMLGKFERGETTLEEVLRIASSE